MELAELLLKYIEVLVYPVMILVIFFALKKQIQEMLNGKLSAKYKGFTIEIEKKNNEIQSIQQNIKTVSSEVETELKKIAKQDQWSGFDYDLQRISNAIRNLDINPEQHRIIDFIRKKGGYGSVAEVVEEIIRPGIHIEVNEFQTKKQMLDLAIERLMEKGILSKSEKGKLQIHPLISQSMSKSPNKANSAGAKKRAAD